MTLLAVRCSPWPRSSALEDRSQEAAPLAEDAVALFDLKGNVVAAPKARAVLAELR